MNLPDAFLKQPKALVFVEAVAAISAVGLVDFDTPWNYPLLIFYTLPIFFVGWHGGYRVGIAMAVFSSAVSWIANLDSHPYHSLFGYAWAATNRFVAFLFVAIGGASMMSHRETMRARLEALDRTRELEQEIVRVSEHEQMRIGQDLHDGVCQTLAAIDCAAACLKADLEAKSLPQVEAAGIIQKLLREAVIEARSLARGIFPVHMDAEGLSAALQELVETTNHLRQVSITFEAAEEIRIGDPGVAMHLYRIGQEALSNAMRHARATHVAVRLAQTDHTLTMSIADDGCGISSTPTSSEGMGLRTMRYRARLIGANFDVLTNPSGGTAVRCSIPLPDDSRT